MIKKYLKPLYVSAALGVISTTWTILVVNLYGAIIIAAIWILVAFGLIRLSALAKFAYYLVGGAVILTILFNVYNPFLNDGSKGSNAISTTTTTVPDPEGTIVVDGGSGVLANGGSFSYIGESARGLEAYLAEGGANATYMVSIDNGSYFSNYNLLVKLSDDAKHNDGARDATITINNNQILKYTHISENTNGWKWYTIGSVSFRKGENKMVFTKDESTTAAYVMDEFKLIPIN